MGETPRRSTGGRRRCPSAPRHPVTDRRCWFNQIAFLNEWTLDPEVREFLVDTYGSEGLPFTTRSPEISQAIFEDVKGVVVTTLDIEDQADDLERETGLYGNLPELDSLTVVKLIVAFRKRFEIEIEINGDIFDTLGRLAAFVESNVRWEPLGGVKN